MARALVLVRAPITSGAGPAQDFLHARCGIAEGGSIDPACRRDGAVDRSSQRAVLDPEVVGEAGHEPTCGDAPAGIGMVDRLRKRQDGLVGATQLQQGATVIHQRCRPLEERSCGRERAL
jgi:hypothetical protein